MISAFQTAFVSDPGNDGLKAEEVSNFKFVVTPTAGSALTVGGSGIASGLTHDGATIYLFLTSAGTITGATSTNGGTTADTPVFTLVMSTSDGSITQTQLLEIDHPTVETGSPYNDDRVYLDSSAYSIQIGADIKTVDGDNDSVTQTVVAGTDIGGEIGFGDDGPVLSSFDDLIVPSSAGHTILSEAFTATPGSDGYYAGRFDDSVDLSFASTSSYVLFLKADDGDPNSVTYYTTGNNKEDGAVFYEITLKADGSIDFNLVTPRPTVTQSSGDLTSSVITGGSGLSSYTFAPSLFDDAFAVALTGYYKNGSLGTLTISKDELGTNGNVVQKGESIRVDIQQQPGYENSTIDTVTLGLATTAGYKPGVTTIGVYAVYTGSDGHQYSTATSTIVTNYSTEVDVSALGLPASVPSGVTLVLDYIQFSPTNTNLKIADLSLDYTYQQVPADILADFNVTIKDGDGDVTGLSTLHVDLAAGTANVDQIFTGGSNDLISALAGDDVVRSDGGIDLIDGGSGNDNIDAGSGADRVEGGLGLDVLTGGADSDAFVFRQGQGGASNADTITDFVSGVDHIVIVDAISTTLSAIAGGYQVTATFAGAAAPEVFTIYTSSPIAASDVTALLPVITLTDGSDSIQTSSDNDVVVGLAGDDTLKTDGGNDNVNSGSGNDLVESGTGNDIVEGGSGLDTIYTGSGSDQVLYRQGQGGLLNADTLADFESGHDKIVLLNATSTVLSSLADGSGYQVTATFSGGATDVFTLYTSSHVSSSDISISLAPIAIDLSKDSSIDYLSAASSGLGHPVVGPQDGLLIYDHNSDGHVSGQDEYVFTMWGNGDPSVATDMQALSAYFDTDHNGVFDAHDAAWQHFGVWQDLNSDGVQQDGEFYGLSHWGITSIDLNYESGSHIYSAADGDVQVYGQMTIGYADGTTGGAEDMAFLVQSPETLSTTTTSEPLDVHGLVSTYLDTMVAVADANHDGLYDGSHSPAEFAYQLDTMITDYIQHNGLSDADYAHIHQDVIDHLASDLNDVIPGTDHDIAFNDQGHVTDDAAVLALADQHFQDLLDHHNSIDDSAYHVVAHIADTSSV